MNLRAQDIPGLPPPEVQPAAFEMAGIGLHLGGTAILQDVDLQLPPGRVMALLGPSGSGKTTLLRLVAGLLAPDRGTIRLGGQLVAQAGRALPPEARGLGMVFQDYALWPHMSVAGNVGFPLEMRRLSAAERSLRVARALERVGLGAFADRRPAELSGGQQQRVAIARAIVAEPALVLFDEPLSNLDRELRESMVEEIAGLVAELGLTALYVTHDHAEAFSLADTVAVMEAGRIAQIAAPETLVADPASASIARFLRLGALLPARRGPGGWHLERGARLAPAAVAPGEAATVLLPATAICPVAPGPAAIGARVIRTLFRGDGHLATLALEGGHEIQLLLPRRPVPGEMLGLRISEPQLRWFPPAPHRSFPHPSSPSERLSP
ncbi:ABC transporter ATP-binding protein [Rhodobacter maris]|uniref:Iron(III) transport system ATP-binding protein n=1 Tax=Rhodobacter maris TaxID=446682 RepID=A0A285S0M2_9RHOB|nr:ABC transporter ATP-binding protein [Rhodobacter maris]SOC00360.1 iron(III) transport system ATP-binding protein [Rhodobacter maris]